VDAFDAFRQAPSAERLYFDADMHWTPRGHEIMADVLFRYLQKPVVAEAQSPPVP
jgi:phospholipase/lecithinase/hemolysin